MHGRQLATREGPDLEHTMVVLLYLLVHFAEGADVDDFDLGIANRREDPGYLHVQSFVVFIVTVPLLPMQPNSVNMDLHDFPLGINFFRRLLH
jgi:hypothetical protein